MKELSEAMTGSATSIINEIEDYERDFENWKNRSETIIKRYRDEVNISSTNAEIVQRTFNILWANTETLAPTLYARLPQVVVERRFKDKDPVGRAACTIAERLGSYVVETSGTNEVIKASVLDLLLPGRAVAWVTYKAEMGEQPVMDPMGMPVIGPDGQPMTEPVKISEEIIPLYVDWRDFGHQVKRTWPEVMRVWRRVYMTRKQLVERFGEELGNKIPLDRDPAQKDSNLETIKDVAAIYEVWCKDTKKVKWCHKTEKDCLDEIDPPLDLEGFWPCPRPLWSIMTNGTLIPIPLYCQYQDQAAELDKITNRIGRLTDALKIVGVYNSSIGELQRILQPRGTPDNTLVPVEDWGSLSEKGGLRGAIDLVPLADIASVLLQCYQARDQIKQTIYEITGISDIVRGSTNPNETLGAQQLKGQYGSIRIRSLQSDVARYSRDIARIIVEIGIEMFEPSTIYAMIGGEGAMPQEEFQAAMELLRNDKLRSFHIDIETDSTIALDEQQDKQSAIEFTQAVGGFLQQAAPLVQNAPMLAPMVSETMMFLVRRFRAGRSLEAVMTQSMDAMVQAVMQPKEPQPDPKLIKVQGDLKLGEQKNQLQAQKQQGEAMFKAQDLKIKSEEVQLEKIRTIADITRPDNVVDLRIN